MVNSLQRRGSFHASLSARNRGDSKGWRGDGKPGLEGKVSMSFQSGQWRPMSLSEEDYQVDLGENLTNNCLGQLPCALV